MTPLHSHHGLRLHRRHRSDALNDAFKFVDQSRYRHAMHRAHPYRRVVPDDWTPLPYWVRVQLAPTVHRGPVIEGGA